MPPHSSRHLTNWLTERPARAYHINIMVESEALTPIFHALGDPTRRRMLRALADGERTVGELAEPFPMSLAAASKHIKVLESAGLIRREIRWRTHVCRLDPGRWRRRTSGSASTSASGPAAWTTSNASSARSDDRKRQTPEGRRPMNDLATSTPTAP